jgi:hypothetical protein
VDGTADPTGRFPARFPSAVLRPRGLPWPDRIEYAMKELGGKTLKVDSPDYFAKAVTEIPRSIGTNRRVFTTIQIVSGYYGLGMARDGYRY